MRNTLFLLIYLLVSSSVTLAVPVSPSHELKLVKRSQIYLSEPNLTQAEWHWIRKKRTLILGTATPNVPPYDITSGLNDYDGINADYIGLIAYNLNMQVRVIYYENKELMLQDLKEGSIDLISKANNYDKNKDILLTQPYLPYKPVIIERTNNTGHLIEYKSIIIQKVLSKNKELKRKYPEANFLTYESTRRALEDLSFGKVDAYIGDATSAQYFIAQANLNNLRIKPLPKENLSGFSFGVIKKNPQLVTILNKTLATIPENINVDIQRRWSGSTPLFKGNNPIIYTPLERKWLAENPVITVSVNNDSPALNFLDNQGYFHGLTADILEAIKFQTGLKFEVSNAGSLQTALNNARTGKTDIVAGVTLDVIGQTSLLPTRTYLYNSWVLIGHKQQSKNPPPRRIAIITGYPLKALLIEKFPHSEVIEVPTAQQGLEELSGNKIDTLALPLIGTDFLLYRHADKNLQIMSTLDTKPARFVFGVSKDKYPLVTILDKALLSIPPEDMHAMTSNSYNNGYLLEELSVANMSTNKKHISMSLALGALSVILGLLTLLSYFVYRLVQRKINGISLEMQLRQQALLNAIPMPIYITDFKEQVIAGNNRFFTSINATPTQAIGHYLDDYHLKLSGAADISLGKPNGDPHALFVKRQLTIDNEIRTIEQWNALCYTTEKRRAYGNVGGWHDITEQEQLISQLKQAKESADKASRAKTNFLATMSHEIRTPMNAIIGMLELTLRRHQNGDLTDWTSLQTAYHSANSLLSLIGDILDISRIESDRLVLHPERANLRNLIESVITMFDGIARKKSIQFTLEMDAEIAGEVFIDPLRFKQILSNLISNAIKFTDAGNVIVRIQADYIDEESLAFQVKIIDTGKGMDNSTQQSLFQPFFQGNSGVQKQGGAGLGLYICQTLVNMMGGSISLMSELGIGTEVTLSLSVLRLEKLGKNTVAPVPNAAQQCPLDILILEDHPVGRMLLHQQLVFLGHKVTEVNNGEQALAILENRTFDVIITDCQMLDMDGYHFSREFRKYEQATGLNRTPLWGLTANVLGDVRQDCINSGMDDCLFKPLGLNILAEKLRSIPTKSLIAIPDVRPPIAESAALAFDISLLPTELRRQDVVNEFLHVMLESLREDSNQLKQVKQFRPFRIEEVRHLAHKILGAIRLLSNESLIYQYNELQHDPDMQKLESALAETDDLITKIVLYLQSLENAVGTTSE